MPPISVSKIIPVIAVGLILAASIPVNWSFFRAEAVSSAPLDATFKRLAQGKITEELTTRYSASSPIKDLGIEAFGSLSYFVFHEARSQAQIGQDGRLFSNEEFETGPTSLATIDKAVAFIADVDQHLKHQNVALMIALLPLKADIDAASHVGNPLPKELSGRYNAVRDMLVARGVKAVDLRKAFLWRNQQARLFLATDTHWSTAGAALAADVISRAVSLPGIPCGKPYSLVQDAPVMRVGDLTRYVRLLPLLEHFGPKPETLFPVRAEIGGAQASLTQANSLSADDLFDSAVPPITLVGTSYSANPVFSFESYLKVKLQCDVLNMAEEGKGPFAPMTTYLASEGFRANPPKLVIWEIPIRYLDDDYPAEMFVLPDKR